MAVLQLVNVSKHFGAIRALSEISFNLHAGEVIGVVGDLGAGKSTLVKIVAGLLQPSSGMMVLDGEQVRFRDAAEARRHGLELVPQDLALCDNLSAAANVFLGRELRWRFGPFGILNHSAMRARADGLFTELRSDTRPRDLVRRLSGAQRRAVAVARTRLADAKVVVLDEPNATCGEREAAQTLDLIRRLRDQGVGVLLISHQMPDLFAVCDRLLVLRHGRKVTECATAATTPEQISMFLTGGAHAA